MLQQRASGEEPAAATHELVSAGAPAERAWDLENILMTLVSVALTVVWFCRSVTSAMHTYYQIEKNLTQSVYRFEIRKTGLLKLVC